MRSRTLRLVYAALDPMQMLQASALTSGARFPDAGSLAALRL